MLRSSSATSMYTNISKAQAFPLAAKISSQPRCFTSLPTLKFQSLPFVTNPRYKFGTLEVRRVANPNGLVLRIARRYCSSRSFSMPASAEKQLPWLVANEGRRVEKGRRSKVSSSIQEDSAKKVSGSSKSSWEQSMEMLEKSTVPESKKRAPAAPVSKGRERRNVVVEKVREQRNDYGRRYGKFDDNVEGGRRYGKFDDNDKGDRRYGKFDDSDEGGRRYGKFDDSDEGGRRYGKFDDSDEGGGDDEMEEPVDNPRWDNIKNRFNGMRGRVGGERPEFRRWDRQENWGRKTWKEASESTVPRIVGEGIYGVGPVLAALSAGRREFYALYVQEGLDLSSNNRKKKDKKGFEKVMKIAEKFGLSIKEVSKHDLNMVVDNRPHQGLVLDASPLEMVKIMELDPVSVGEGEGSLWVALDEVTDPQNLGAIIRSAYFFGVSGIVLCAKNSAPLSGVVSKASAGSLELMELRYCKNMMQFLVASAENGWRVLGGSVSSKAVSLDEVTPGPPTILVLGSEGTGLRPLVERSCTQLVTIPGSIPFDSSTSELDGESTALNCESSGKEFLSFLAVESLNVSVAAGVLLHHLIGKKSVDLSQGEHRHTDGSE